MKKYTQRDCVWVCESTRERERSCLRLLWKLAPEGKQENMTNGCRVQVPPSGFFFFSSYDAAMSLNYGNIITTRTGNMGMGQYRPVATWGTAESFQWVKLIVGVKEAWQEVTSLRMCVVGPITKKSKTFSASALADQLYSEWDPSETVVSWLRVAASCFTL